MLLIGEGIDDAKTRGRISERAQPLLCKRPDDGDCHPALEILRDITDRLTATQRDVVRRLNRVAAQLRDGNLERRPRAQRGLLEEHRHVEAVERLWVTAPRRTRSLERRGLRQAGGQFRWAEVQDREEPRRHGSNDGHLERCPFHRLASNLVRCARSDIRH